MEEPTQLQRLLIRLRDEHCDGNAAELARRIGKDASYVNRLFYPPNKAGAKGIGLEIMKACSEAFNLPVGYWEGADRIVWPFTIVSLDRVLALSEARRAFVEGKLAAAIEEAEGPNGPKPKRLSLKDITVKRANSNKSRKKLS